jgi:hypothetical protein
MRSRDPARAVVAFCLLSVAFAGCRPSAAAIAPLPPGGHHVLFIGNSLTYTNDLPRTLTELAATTGDTIRTATVAYANFALEDHVAEGTAMKQIALGGWEYVVLQQGPSSVEANRANLIAMTQLFDQSIRALGARTALYGVWPAAANFGDFARAIDSYALAAEAVHGLMLPAGSAWLAAWAKDSALALYGGDGLHPSALGTYLVALVMYERFTGRDARALSMRVVVGGSVVSVADGTVRLLQQAAHETNARYAARSGAANRPSGDANRSLVERIP